MPTTSWPWAGALTDAWEWVASGDDPAARRLLLTGVLDRPPDDPEVAEARHTMLADPAAADLLAPWDDPSPIGGHNHPAFAPNLLADRDLRGGDAGVDRILDQALEHQEPDGRLASCSAPRAGAQQVWGVLPCDTNAPAPPGREQHVRDRGGEGPDGGCPTPGVR